ncbi:lactonase family protein [Croceivirga thetidis]|uniref:Lactonase family protein n=1 Tax=Croceivirga thetidis TaxID=2721623 RepID=A0ABX1GMD3_9FLAO|nr:lactonase family protein [Croceivirga thetidis]NKI31066.1 lactonase family protein [Croceivirga thetidis]
MKNSRNLLIIALLFCITSCTQKKEPWMKLYVGTYTDGSSEGIYTLKLNPETGELDSLELKAKLPNPSFLALSTEKDYLYAVQETADFDSLGGGVTAFSIKDGILTELNSKGSGGAHPCHVSLSENSQLAVSNYTGGNVAVFDLNDDGSLGDRQLLNHNPKDSTGIAHAHKAVFTEDGLFVADLGLDAVKRYGKQPYGWIPAHQASLDLKEGAGPRHFTFTTDQSFLYLINELNSTITVFQRDDEGSYNPVQTESTLDANFEGESFCADIHLSADGKYLYGSNRGENTIVIFTVDKTSGQLSLVGRESVQGDWPRNFTISPDGNFVLVANQKSNNISVFKRNQELGTLEFSNQFAIGAPVCLVFN